jgi:hypothetical protein
LHGHGVTRNCSKQVAQTTKAFDDLFQSAAEFDLKVYISMLQQLRQQFKASDLAQLAQT